MSSSILKHLLSALLILCFVACEGPEGDPGPQGPQGQSGAANISLLSADASTWFPSGTPGTSTDGYESSFSVPGITSGVINNGFVLAYVSSGGNFIQLPTTLAFNDYTRHFLFSYSIGAVTFAVQDSDLQTIDPGNYIFRIVIVEGAFKNHTLTYEEATKLPGARVINLSTN